jgi:hypothetical protein
VSKNELVKDRAVRTFIVNVICTQITALTNVNVHVNADVLVQIFAYTCSLELELSLKAPPSVGHMPINLAYSEGFPAAGTYFFALEVGHSESKERGGK